MTDFRIKSFRKYCPDETYFYGPCLTNETVEAQQHRGAVTTNVSLYL